MSQARQIQVRGTRIVLALALCGAILFARPVEARAPIVPVLAGALAVITYLTGAVEVLELGARAWRAVRQMESLKKGDQVKVAENAKLEITLFDASVVRMDGGSEAALDDLDRAKGSLWGKVRLLVGSLWARLAKKSKHDGFEVQASGATVTPRGTTYGLRCSTDGAKVCVYDGDVVVRRSKKAPAIGSLRPKEVSRADWSRAVEHGRWLEWTEDAGEKASGANEAAADPWTAWNRERDDRFERLGAEAILSEAQAEMSGASPAAPAIAPATTPSRNEVTSPSEQTPPVGGDPPKVQPTQGGSR